MVKIVNIGIYRDGGSIEFTIQRVGAPTKHIWLETPFSGELRDLLINSVRVERGSVEVKELLEDIEKWWKKLPDPIKRAINRRKGSKTPCSNQSPEALSAIDLSLVIDVRDYVREVYWSDSSLA